MNDKPKKPVPVAVIDVGSSFLRMLIGQIDAKGRIIVIDDLVKSTNIGRDTFSIGRVTADSIYETCDTIKGFAALMKDYHVRNYRAVATSGLRDAANKEYVLDQILNRTGIDVQIINTAQERYYTFKALVVTCKNLPEMQQEGLLLVNMGSGGLGITLYNSGKMKLREYFKIGSLRLWESLSEMEKTTPDFPKLMEEFLESQIYSVHERILKEDPKHFVCLGGQLSQICALCHSEGGNHSAPDVISRHALAIIVKKIEKMTIEQITSAFGLSRNDIETILPSIIILHKMLQMSGAELIYAPTAALRQGILVDIGDKIMKSEKQKFFNEDILNSVWYLGEKFGIDKKHCRKVFDISLAIFDAAKKMHGMGENERLLLMICAIMHDVGRFVNVNQHDIQGYSLMKSTEIMGFSNYEIELMANIVMYHSSTHPSPTDVNYAVLSEDDKILVSKLAAILKLAEALDTTHKQRIRTVEVEKNGRELLIKVQTDDNILLEEWNFKSAAVFFEEVMGYKPVFRKKGR